jgi:hypothetical protein
MLNYAILIPTYKRPDNVITLKTLKEANYKGKVYLIVGDDDETLDKYKKIYGDMVIEFSKQKIRPYIDMLDNFKKTKAVVYARNVMFSIAKNLGLDYFCVLDDDYDRFKLRRVFKTNKKDILRDFKLLDVSGVIEKSFEYLHNTPSLDCFAWSQSGDFIGGADTFEKINGKRKIMNAFFFKTNTPIRFMGSINEDLNSSVYEGQRGKVFFTIHDVSINQKDTQQNSGGLTDIYLDMGTYVKSFYSVIVAPNCVKVSAMGNNDLRLHHRVNWNLACPKIIREKHKKG